MRPLFVIQKLLFLPSSSSTKFVKLSSKVGSFYSPDPADFLQTWPRKEMTITALRVSKNHVHYAHTKLIDSSNVRVVQTGVFPIVVASSQRIAGNSSDGDTDSASEDESEGENNNAKRSSKRGVMVENTECITQVLSRIVDEVPSADAYLVENVSNSAMRARQRSVRRILRDILQRTMVIRDCLSTKWRKQQQKDEECELLAEEALHTEPEPIFESDGKFVEKTFQLRKPGNGMMCESLAPVVKVLPNGYSTANGIIQAEIMDDIMKYLRERTRQPLAAMEKHLLCAVILESVAFAKYLVGLRSKESTDFKEEGHQLNNADVE